MYIFAKKNTTGGMKYAYHMIPQDVPRCKSTGVTEIVNVHRGQNLSTQKKGVFLLCY